MVLGWTGYREGGEVTLRAVAEVDWVFDHWEGVGSGENERSNPVLYRMGGGARSKAVFVSSPGAGRFKGGSVVLSYKFLDLDFPNWPVLTDAVSVSAGNNHVMALLADGTVRAWGGNHYQYGQSVVPTGLPKMKAVAAGQNISLALSVNGKVYQWGLVDLPQPPAMGEVVAISAGDDHNLALLKTGEVMAWGADPNSDKIKIPADLYDYGTIVDVAAGRSQSVALTDRGVVLQWGAGGGVMLGRWTDRRSGNGRFTVSVLVDGGATQVSAGPFHTAVLMADGSVKVWKTQDFRERSFDAEPAWNSFVQVSVGEAMTVGLQADGRVLRWYKEGWPNPTLTKNQWDGGYVKIDAGYDWWVGIQAPAGLVRDGPDQVFVEEGRQCVWRSTWGLPDRYAG